MHKMKKNKGNTKHKNRKNKKPSLPKESAIESIYSCVEISGLRGYGQLFVALFMVWFLGSHLLEAINNLYILNIRVPNKVFLNENPIWFSFVLFFKLLFFLFSVGYVLYYIKARVKGKNA